MQLGYRCRFRNGIAILLHAEKVNSHSFPRMGEGFLCSIGAGKAARKIREHDRNSIVIVVENCGVSVNFSLHTNSPFIRKEGLSEDQGNSIIRLLLDAFQCPNGDAFDRVYHRDLSGFNRMLEPVMISGASNCVPSIS